MSSKNRNEDGFTLLEISIVLGVIGLLVGGIVLGQTLIRQSQLMSVTTDVQNYISAAKAFQQKYGMLPGDITNAQSIWGTNPNCATFGAGTGTQTCNGLGYGQVGHKAVGGNPQENFETLLFWQHLALAGMISGHYTGSSTDAGGYYSVPGTNVPASKISGAGYSFIFVGNLPTDACCNLGGWFAGNYGHVIELGGIDNVYYAETWTPNVLTAAEAASIDSKIDDGRPGTGKVVAPDGYAAPLCASNYDHTSAIYNVNTTAVGASQASCALIFITGM